MKIIDAHHHFWDPVANNHPWLREDPMIPFRYGNYDSIRKPFMSEDYDAASKNWDIVASVTMEGEWTATDPTGEAIWMQRLHDETGRPAAHVAQIWLDRPNLADVLKTYTRLPIVRSVRHKPRANATAGGPAGGMMDPAFRDGFRRLADHGLMFDLQTPYWHLHEAVDMAAIAPETKIILNHAGLPADRSPQGLAQWRKALATFATLPHAFVKISGLGLPGRPWFLDDNRDIIRFCIDCFGPKRAMFASNFPVDRLCGSFDTIFSGFDAATRDLTESDREALFRTTAENLYGPFPKL